MPTATAWIKPPEAALVSRVIDPGAGDDARLSAAARLGFREHVRYRAVAVAGLRAPSGRAGYAVPAGQPGTAFHWTAPFRGMCASVVPSAATTECSGELPLCAGIGPAVDLMDLPRSFHGALAGLRFTASGSRQDPGPRVVRFDDLGAIALLSDAADALRGGNPDLDGIVRARRTQEWAMPTMVAIAASCSLRDAAKTLYLHHSSLNARATVLEEVLGWSLRTPAGRRRLDVALTIDRLRRNADLPRAAAC